MRSAAGTLVAVLLAVLWFALTATHGLNLQDEGGILLRSQRVLEKALPNRDFADVYGPGVSVVNALLLGAFGRRILAVRWSLVAVKAVAVAAVWIASREAAPRAIAATATAFAILTFGRATWNLNTPYAALYVLALGLVALAALLRARAVGSSALAGVAGVAVGTALLFKYSLATMYGAALGLGVLAAAMLEPDAPRGPWTRRLLAGTFVVLLALPFVLHEFPFRFVGPADYLRFFAPAHVLGVLVLLARPEPTARGLPTRALAAVAAGAALVPLACAAVYGSRGALAYAVADLLQRTRMYGNYAAPIGIPTSAAVFLLASVLALSVSAGCAGRRRWRPAAGALGLAALCGAAAARAAGDATLVAAADTLAPVVPSLLAWALLAVCAPALRRSPRPAWVVPAVVVCFFHHATEFQIFPRAGFNVLMALPAVAPAVAVLGGAAWRRLDGGSSHGARRAAAVAAVALPAVVLASPAVWSVVDLATAPKVPIPFPETRGLSIREDDAERVRALRALVDFLARDHERPVFLVNNDAMILFLSRSRPALGSHALTFELMGYLMLEPHVLTPTLVSTMLSELVGARDPIVILKDDGTTANIRLYMPLLGRYLDRNFEPEFAAGPYQTLRRRAPEAASSAEPAH